MPTLGNKIFVSAILYLGVELMLLNKAISNNAYYLFLIMITNKFEE